MAGIVKVFMTRGHVALVNAADAPAVAGVQWYPQRQREIIYAVDRAGRYMHRLILGLPRGARTDHKNGNGLDNRRRNLRVATVSQNGANVGKKTPWEQVPTSKYKGVHRTRSGRWWAYINCQGKRADLGRFDTEAAAARAYNRAARRLFGQFARPNKVPR